MVIFEFDDTQGLAIVDFDGCYYYPTAKLKPFIEEWVKENCTGKCSIVCHLCYDYILFGYPGPFDDDTAVYTIFFENEIDAIKFKLFWL